MDVGAPDGIRDIDGGTTRITHDKLGHAAHRGIAAVSGTLLVIVTGYGLPRACASTTHVTESAYRAIVTRSGIVYEVTTYNRVTGVVSTRLPIGTFIG